MERLHEPSKALRVAQFIANRLFVIDAWANMPASLDMKVTPPEPAARPEWVVCDRPEDGYQRNDTW